MNIGGDFKRSLHEFLCQRGIFWPWVPFILLLAAVTVFYGCMVGNSLVFAGDGSRIPTYIDFIDNSRELFPLWNPYKVVGMPVLADPERFTLLGYLLDFDDPFFFLKLNLLTLALVIFFSSSLYFFYRACGFSKAGSAVATFIISTSGLFGVLYYLGRLYAMITIALTLLALGVLLRSGGAPKSMQQMLIGGLTGLCIAMSGYYALVLPLGMLFVLAFAFRMKDGDILAAFKEAVFQTIKYTGFGLCLFAGLILPPLFYNIGTIGLPAEGTFGKALSPPATFINTFMPLETGGFALIKGQVFPYISLLLLPGLALFAGTVKGKFSPVRFSLVFFSAVTLFLLIAGISSLAWFVRLYESLPIISHIRQVGSFQYVFAIAAMGLAIMGFEAVDIDKRKTWGGFCAGILLAAVLVVLSPRSGGFIRVHVVEIVAYLALMACGLALFLRWQRYAFVLPVLYAVACLGHVAFGDHIAHKMQIERTAASGKKIAGKSILSRKTDEMFVMPEDAFPVREGYFRIYCDHSTKCPPLGTGEMQGVQGFSLFFSMEARPILSVLSVDNVLHQRPHWMKFKKCDALDPVWLDILNVRYVLCRDNKETPSGMRKTGEHESVSVFMNQRWQQGVRFFSRWEKRTESLTEEQIKENWQRGIAVIDADPGFVSARQGSFPAFSLTPDVFSEGRMEISVEAPAEGILYLPELYSKDWIVRVDGQEARLLKVFGSFRGVALAAGRHRVEFIYRPVVVYFSFLISAMTFLAFCIYGWRQRHATAS